MKKKKMSKIKEALFWTAAIGGAVVTAKIIAEKKNREYMKEAEAAGQIATLPLGIYLKVEEYKDGFVTARLINNSGYLMTYGDEYGLQKCEEGVWLDLAPVKEIYDFGEKHEIEDLKEIQLVYDLSVFGDLPKGHYRLMKTDLSAEFDI